MKTKNALFTTLISMVAMFLAAMFSSTVLAAEANQVAFADVFEQFGLGAYITVGFAFAYVLTLIAAWTPNKSDDKAMDLFWKLINRVGGNYGKARNKDE